MQRGGQTQHNAPPLARRFCLVHYAVHYAWAPANPSAGGEGLLNFQGSLERQRRACLRPKGLVPLPQTEDWHLVFCSPC